MVRLLNTHIAFDPQDLSPSILGKAPEHSHNSKTLESLTLRAPNYLTQLLSKSGVTHGQSRYLGSEVKEEGTVMPRTTGTS